jgi:hypothetical protein
VCFLWMIQLINDVFVGVNSVYSGKLFHSWGIVTILSLNNIN